MKVKFWGVRGSTPAPITGKQVETKITEATTRFAKDLKDPDYLSLPSIPDEGNIKKWVHELPFSQRATYGGNTSCVEVRCGDQLLILDMGTGLRGLGNSLMPEMFKTGGVKGTILQSHVHWDHIQGFPFFVPLYMPNAKFGNHFTFYGGKEWDGSLEEVLQGQMDHPVFPVKIAEIQQTGMKMDFHTVHDGFEFEVVTGPGEIDRVGNHPPVYPKAVIQCRKLNHPQETFGYRITHYGPPKRDASGWAPPTGPKLATIAYCTDHEPYGGSVVHGGLLELAKDADILITDCQYSHDEYCGKSGGVQKMGWGHSYPEYIAEVAKAANCKSVVTFHHDPSSDDVRIEELAAKVEEESGIRTVPAYEGLEIDLNV